jgi:tight adherence protein C
MNVQIGWTIVLAFSLFALFYMVFNRIMQRRAEGGPGGGSGRRYAEGLDFFETVSPLVEAFKGPAGLYLSTMSSKDIKDLEGQLGDAGLVGRMSLQDFIGLRIVCGLFGMFFGFMMLLVGLPLPLAMMGIFMFGLAGWIGPVSWLSSAGTERQGKIFRGLSDTLDVLAVSVNAGLELREALQRVVDIGSEPELDREITRTLEEIDKGGKSLRQGFEDLRDRINIPEMTAFCNVVLMAFQIGAAGMGGILMEQAEAIRKERILRAENQANTMSSKIIFPIAVFIFPAVIVTILGPMSLEAYLQFGRG